MNAETFLAAAFVAVSYTAWPNLSKPLGVNSNLVAFIVVLIALVVITIIARNDFGSVTSISMKAAMWILGISIANGLAIYVQASTAANKEIQTGIFLVSIFILQVVAAPVIDWFVNGIVPTVRQIVGLGLSVPTLLLLVKI
jgi:hypothetical protein